MSMCDMRTPFPILVNRLLQEESWEVCMCSRQTTDGRKWSSTALQKSYTRWVPVKNPTQGGYQLLILHKIDTSQKSYTFWVPDINPTQDRYQSKILQKVGNSHKSYTRWVTVINPTQGGNQT